MKNKNKYEGKSYKFKKNSIKKTKEKYINTYLYILNKILKYKKYINGLEKSINYNEKNCDKIILKIIESTGKDLNIDNKKIYNYKKYNKLIIKNLKKILKNEKNTNTENKLKIIKVYKKIENKEYKELRNLALNKPNDLLKGIYLYTLRED
jgi:hypothetical protein